MIKRILFLFTIFSFTTCFANLTVNSINIRKNNADLETKIADSCKSLKDNIGLYIKCKDQLIDKYQDEGLFEGTKQYAEKNYSNLDNEALHQKMIELMERRKTARTYVDSQDDHTPGELTKEDYNSEISWVQGELKKRHYMTPEQKKAADWYKEHVTVVRPGQ
jgi:hypothetical protein